MYVAFIGLNFPFVKFGVGVFDFNGFEVCLFAWFHILFRSLHDNKTFTDNMQYNEDVYDAMLDIFGCQP